MIPTDLFTRNLCTGAQTTLRRNQSIRTGLPLHCLRASSLFAESSGISLVASGLYTLCTYSHEVRQELTSNAYILMSCYLFTRIHYLRAHSLTLVLHFLFVPLLRDALCRGKTEPEKPGHRGRCQDDHYVYGRR